MGINLFCVTHAKACKIMKEVHTRECGPHMNGRMLAKKVQRMGYYSPTMEGDCHAYVRSVVTAKYILTCTLTFVFPVGTNFPMALLSLRNRQN